jgi:drug/metabolite transporter (DMT)-like permease
MLAERWAALYARVALGAAFLSGVAARFGLWGSQSSWKNFADFTRYTAEVNSFMPAFTIPYLAWSATAAELVLGIALIAGIRLRWMALASARLLGLLRLGRSAPARAPCAGRPGVRRVRPREGTAAGDWLLLIVPGVIWGASFLFIAEALEAVGPNGITFARIAVGFATLALVPAARRGVPGQAWGWIALLSVVWLAFPLSMFPFAEQRVSSALTGMLNGANPLFTAIVAAVLARRLPSGGIVLGLAVGLTGAALVALPAIGEGRSSAVGIALILVALLSYGVALNVMGPLQQEHGALPVIWRAQAIALLLTAPLGLPELAAARWARGPLLAILALGALGTGVAYAVIATASGRLGATRASATTFLIPPVALVLGVLVRSEAVALLSVIGGVVCVAGAWLMRRASTPDAYPAAIDTPAEMSTAPER